MIVNKTVYDYVDELSERYPDVNKKDILRILIYGWKQLYLFNSYGGDVIITTNKLWCYFGNLYNDSIKFFTYYIKKLSVKFRIMYKRSKKEWDGYYYFALSDNQYEEYLKLIKGKGRKRKIFTFLNVFMYKLLDECKIKCSNRKYIFRVHYPVELGFFIYKKEFITKDVELIITRDVLKFKDILVTNNNYEFI